MSDLIVRATVTFIAILFALAFALGALAVWGLPEMWELVKPWIHQVTA